MNNTTLVGENWINYFLDHEEYELKHYGVLGMKWGIRRYQPYPPGKHGTYLGDRIGARPLKYHSRAANYVKRIGIQTLKQTIALLVPGARLVTSAHTIHQLAKYNFDNGEYIKQDGSFEKKSQLAKKDKKTTALEDTALVNPYKGRKGGVNNCFDCTVALELRRRGYDVRARRSGHGNSTSRYTDMFLGLKQQVSSLSRESKESRKSWVMRSYQYLTKNLEANPEGSRGFVAFKYEKMNGGHTMFWEIQNGQVVFYDGQSGGTSGVDKCLSFSDQNYLWGRLDNCSITDEVGTVAVSRKKR